MRAALRQAGNALLFIYGLGLWVYCLFVLTRSLLLVLAALVLTL